MIEESKCKFEKRSDYNYIKIDDHEEYRRISQNFLKCVDVIIANKDVYFVEIKCYEFFNDGFDDKINEMLQKLKDTLYFLLFYELESEEITSIKEKLCHRNPYFVIIICPPCNPQRESVPPDKIRALRESLAKKLKGFLDYVLVDTMDNSLNLFSNIVKQQS